MLTLERQNAWRERYRAGHPGWRPATEVFADRVRAELSAGMRILDVGCGRGGLVEQLNHPIQHVVGVDPDVDSLRQHRLPELPRLAGVSGALPFTSDSFDMVAASWLLEHLAQPEQTLLEIARVLRPGGVFIFITPNARHPLARLNQLAGRLGRAQGRLVARLYGRAEADTFPTVYRANTPATVTQLAAAARLTPEGLETIADPTYLAFSNGMFRLMSALEDRLAASRRIHLVGTLRKPGDSGRPIT